MEPENAKRLLYWGIYIIITLAFLCLAAMTIVPILRGISHVN